MRAAVLLALKDLRLLLRDRVALFWVFGFPLLFALLLGAVFDAIADGELAPLPVVLVNEDSGVRAGALAAAIAASPGLIVSRSELASAERDVRAGEAVAYVRIPIGFSQTSSQRPVLGIDPSRRAEAALLTGVIGELARRSREPGAVTTSQQVELATLGVASSARVLSGFDLAFPAALLWGLMGCAATFAISLVAERSAGTLVRLRASPIGRSSILGGKALACFCACSIDAALLVVIARVGLGVHIEQPLASVFAIASAAACFSGITLALGAFGRSEQAVAGAGWAALIVMAMAGGAMVPARAMPEWLSRVGNASPVKWGLVALEGAFWRNFDFADLALPCLVLVSIGAAAFAVGLLALRRSDA
jgi:ABC-2 type transport system permease protein